MKRRAVACLLFVAALVRAQEVPPPTTAQLQAATALARGDAWVGQDRAGLALLYYTQAMQRTPDDPLPRLRVLSLLNYQTFPLPLARLEHPDAVLAAAWSREGRVFATGAKDGSVRLFDVRANAVLPSPAAHPGGALALAFTPDGRMLATGGADGVVCVSDVQTGRTVAELKLKADVVTVAFDEKGERLLLAGAGPVCHVWSWQQPLPALEIPAPAMIRAARLAPRGDLLAMALDSRVLLLDARDGRTLREIPLAATALEFAPDGRHLAAISGTTVHLWDAQTAREITVLHHDGKVNALVFSADGRRLATAADDARARTWNWEQGKLAGPPVNDDAAVLGISLSADGARKATINAIGIVRVWQTDTGQPAAMRIVQQGRSLVAALSPDGNFLLTGEESGVVKSWDVRPGEVRGLPLLLADGWNSLHRGPASELAVTRDATGRALRLINATTSESVGASLKLTAAVRRVVISPDGKRVVTLDQDGRVQVWSATTGAELGEPFKVKPGTVQPQFSPDHRLFAGILGDAVGALDLPAGKLLPYRFELGEAVKIFAFSLDASRLYTGGATGKGRLWNPAAALPLASLDHSGVIHAAQFDPAGRFLATASADKTARLWHAATGASVNPPLAHESAVLSLIFSADGTRLATGTEDGNVRIWNTATGQLMAGPRKFEAPVWRLAFGPATRWLEVATGPTSENIALEVLAVAALTPLERPPGPLHSVAFGPKTRRLLASYTDSRALLFDSVSGQAVGSPLIHHGALSTAIFNAGGNVVLTASWDGTARVWDAEATSPLSQPITFFGPVTEAAFSADETRLLALVEDQYLVVTPLGPWTQRAPDWFPAFVEALIGGRSKDDGTLELADGRRSEALAGLRERLASAPAEDAWAEWGRWFLADRVARPLAPGSKASQTDYRGAREITDPPAR